MMKHKVKLKTKDYVAQGQCNHYWIIEVANGPKSRGVYRYCGESRYFFNSISVLNNLKKNKQPIDLPEMEDVELDEDSKS